MLERILTEIVLDLLVLLRFEDPADLDESTVVRAFEEVDHRLAALDGPAARRFAELLKQAVDRDGTAAQRTFVEEFILAEELERR